MQPLLIATTNPAKLAEYRILLREFGLEPRSLADAGIRDHPDETGATFGENAMLKARFYFERSRGMPTLADDGGLEVDALGGAPGVRSHRWLRAGDNSDRALAEEVVRRMAGIPRERRTARIRAEVALIYRHAGKVCERLAEAAIEGVIADRVYSEIRSGFPYRAVLFLPERNCYLGELGDEEEARISQRREAIAKLADDLRRVAAGGG
jgi:XTP/dITP diphosphohydrolase